MTALHALKVLVSAEPMRIIHIGKTGGTALQEVLETETNALGIRRAVLLPHRRTLPDVRAQFPRAKIGFVVRDPVDRARSGFYSRLRMGKPRRHKKWSAQEKIAFGNFQDWDDLGHALADGRPEAHHAMQTISHLKWDHTHYLKSVEMLEAEQTWITWIGLQKTLDEDFEVLKTQIGLGPQVRLPSDDVAAHRAVAAPPKMSDRAREAFRAHFAKDYDVYEWCLNKRRDLGLG